MWGQIAAAGISAGASLLGGFLGRRSAKKEARRAEQRADTYHQRTRADVEASGINWLTYIRGGGGPGAHATHAPTLGGGAIANAIGFAGESLARGVQAAFDYDPLDERRANLELQIQEATLRNLNQQMAGIGAVPTATGARNIDAGPSLTGNTPFEDGRRTQTWYGAPGSDWQPHPSAPDAQVIEDSLGEPASFLYSIIKTGLDVGHNVRRARDTIRSRWAVSNGGDNRPVWQPPQLTGRSWFGPRVSNPNPRRRTQ